MYSELHVGPFVFRTYTVLIDLGVVTLLALLAQRGHTLEGRAVKWFDIGLAGAVGWLAGARLLHVALHWTYFHNHTGEILQFWAGGLDWHGGLLGALAAGYSYIVARRFDAPPALVDVLALALPIFAAFYWSACLVSTCGYGREVRSLADYPAPLVAELADLYYTVAPRFNTQVFGLAWSALTLALAGWLTWRGQLGGRRFWPTLAFYSAGTLLIAFLRSDETLMVAGLRCDQWFDAALIVGALGMFIRSRNGRQ